MYLHCFARNDAGRMICGAVLRVEDVDAFVRDADLSQWDLVLPKERPHEPGDPGIGWEIDDAGDLIEPVPESAVDSETPRDRFELVPVGGFVSWINGSGVPCSARVLFEDAWRVWIGNRHLQTHTTDELIERVGVAARARRTYQRQRIAAAQIAGSMERIEAVREKHAEAPRKRAERAAVDEAKRIADKVK